MARWPLPTRRASASRLRAKLHPRLRNLGQELRLAGEAAGRLSGLSQRVGGDIAVGIRSEALGGDGTASIDVTIDLVEMLGSEKLVHCTIAAPAVRSTDTGVEIADRADSTIVASLDPRRQVREGDHISFTLDTLRLHAFDLDTGAAIGRS